MLRKLKMTKQITQKETPAVDMYLQDIGRVDLITADEEVILAQKIKRGDERALAKLVNANLRFVVSVAKQYQHQGLALPDLINEGNYGLIKAAHRFDETRGFKFISYAVWWIRQAIMQALNEVGNFIRLPVNKIYEVNKIKKISAQFEQENEREPSDEEIAALADLTKRSTKDGFWRLSKPLSYDAPIDSSAKSYSAKREGEQFNNTNFTTPDAPSTDAKLIADSFMHDVKRVFARFLDQTQVDCIELRFGLRGGKSLLPKEISKELNMPVNVVNNNLIRGIRRLKKSNTARAVLEKYLDA